jgi:FdhD protein
MEPPDFIGIDAYEYSMGSVTPIDVNVSAEYPVTIMINDNPYVVIATSGSDLEALAIGHLVSEGIINSIDEIREIDIRGDRFEINIKTEINDEILERLFKVHSIASGCGHGRNASHQVDKKIVTPPPIEAEVIISSMRTFLRSSVLHKRTRGVHSSALYTIKGDKLIFFDEIGRHNAIDKIVGYALKNNIPLTDKMIFSTGRLSSEIVYKALYASAPIIVSKASPTSLAVELARKYNIVMIGKVRSDSFCIFNGLESIKA